MSYVAPRDKSNMRRINLVIPVELYDYYKSESARLGVSMTALIILDLSRRKEEKEAIKDIGQFQVLLDQLKSVER